MSENEIAVPESFYKTIINPKDTTSISFVISNFITINLEDFNPRDYVFSIDEIEDITGINFLHNMPLDYQTKIESSKNTSHWFD